MKYRPRTVTIEDSASDDTKIEDHVINIPDGSIVGSPVSGLDSDNYRYVTVTWLEPIVPSKSKKTP